MHTDSVSSRTKFVIRGVDCAHLATTPLRLQDRMFRSGISLLRRCPWHVLFFPRLGKDAIAAKRPRIAASSFRTFTDDSGRNTPKTPGEAPFNLNVNKDDEEEDEFSLINSIDEEEVSRLENLKQTSPREAIDVLSQVPHSISKEEAEALVATMVSAASRGMSEEVTAEAAPPPLTVHTLEILRASRISTNRVIAVSVAGYQYPVARKVSAHIDLTHLRLSRLARAALNEIAGPRIRSNLLTINVQKYGTSAENVAHIVGVMTRAIEAAKISVGESFDNTPLLSWEDVLTTARDVTKDDPEEIRKMVDHVASLPEPVDVPFVDLFTGDTAARDETLHSPSQSAAEQVGTKITAPVP